MTMTIVDTAIVPMMIRMRWTNPYDDLRISR
jgi:hypothetical protein